MLRSLPPALRRLVHWLRSRDLIMLLSGLTVVLGLWAFIVIADQVKEGHTQKFDEWAVESLRKPAEPLAPKPAQRSLPIGPPWLREIGRDMTALGGIAVLTLVTAAVAGYLLMLRKYYAVLFVLAAVLGGLLLSTLLKDCFDRPRPEVEQGDSLVFTSSFPSGHSMLSATVYLTLGALLSQFVEQRALKVYFLAVAMLLTFLVGLSRVYLGVHYPTDVLAGWTAGLVWAVLCWLVARYLQLRGTVER